MNIGHVPYNHAVLHSSEKIAAPLAKRLFSSDEVSNLKTSEDAAKSNRSAINDSFVGFATGSIQDSNARSEFAQKPLVFEEKGSLSKEQRLSGTILDDDTSFFKPEGKACSTEEIKEKREEISTSMCLQEGLGDPSLVFGAVPVLANSYENTIRGSINFSDKNAQVRGITYEGEDVVQEEASDQHHYVNWMHIISPIEVQESVESGITRISATDRNSGQSNESQEEIDVPIEESVTTFISPPKNMSRKDEADIGSHYASVEEFIRHPAEGKETNTVLWAAYSKVRQSVCSIFNAICELLKRCFGTKEHDSHLEKRGNDVEEEIYAESGKVLAQKTHDGTQSRDDKEIYANYKEISKKRMHHSGDVSQNNKVAPVIPPYAPTVPQKLEDLRDRIDNIDKRIVNTLPKIILKIKNNCLSDIKDKDNICNTSLYGKMLSVCTEKEYNIPHSFLQKVSEKLAEIAQRNKFTVLDQDILSKDKLDSILIEFLDNISLRIETVKEIGTFKNQTDSSDEQKYAPMRETRVIRKLRSQFTSGASGTKNHAVCSEEDVEEIYREIMAFSLFLQTQHQIVIKYYSPKDSSIKNELEKLFSTTAFVLKEGSATEDIYNLERGLVVTLFPKTPDQIESYLNSELFILKEIKIKKNNYSLLKFKESDSEKIFSSLKSFDELKLNKNHLNSDNKNSKEFSGFQWEQIETEQEVLSLAQQQKAYAAVRAGNIPDSFEKVSDFDVPSQEENVFILSGKTINQTIKEINYKTIIMGSFLEAKKEEFLSNKFNDSTKIFHREKDNKYFFYMTVEASQELQERQELSQVTSSLSQLKIDYRIVGHYT